MLLVPHKDTHLAYRHAQDRMCTQTRHRSTVTYSGELHAEFHKAFSLLRLAGEDVTKNIDSGQTNSYRLTDWAEVASTQNKKYQY